MYRKVIIALLSIVFVVGKLSAQEIEYGVRFDSTQMLIGDQQNLTYLVRSQIPLSVKFPQLDKQVGGMEIVSGPVVDSTYDGNYYTYTNVYKVTTFDTGIYSIPPQSILIAQEGFDNALTTDTIKIAVNTLIVDKEKGMVDIEGPLDNPVTFREALPYILYSLLGLAIVAAIVYMIIRLRSGKPIIGGTASEPVIPPYIAAINGMNSIDERKLWQAGNEKEFYTELTNVLRQYLDGELGLQCMESTSAEIVTYLKGVEYVDEKVRLFIDDMLAAADLVKFAKMTPLQDENFNYMKGTKECIEKIHANIVAFEQAKADEAKKIKETESETDKIEQSNE